LPHIGGHPALDFANTVDRDLQQRETIPDYRSLVNWCVRANVLTVNEAKALRLDAKSDATSAAEWTKEAHILREIATRLYHARASARRAPPADIAALNKRLKRYTVRPELSPSDLGYKRKVASGVVSLAQPIARLADLIAELATSPDFKHVRVCEGLECGWFFLDRSPSHRRRWCSMASCGNRAKTKAHYERGKSAGTPRNSRSLA
jgi:predicted RNA-binding Zn ribbon-like protein